MDTIRICAQCHAPLPTVADGPLCPKCQHTPTGIASFQTPPIPGPNAPPPAAQIAEFFPQLEIFEVLGHGGMGMVYKARQLNLDRMVALKILSPELSSQPAFAERFSREAKALARLHHSNIVAVYDFGRAGPYYYFLMEYVDGVDLHTLIQQKELKPAECLRLVVEICRALQFAHDEGIIHRDIKPANILIDKKGRVKMADFGLAKLIVTDGRRQPDLTQTTGPMGTPQYMAPEQIERPSEVDSRADLYSLGVIFYEMLTGELPLGRFPLPSQKAHTDVKLDEVVLRALEKEPRLRYQHASEILTQVEKFSAPGLASARGRAMNSLLQYGIAGALLLVAALTYALIHLKSQPSVINEVIATNEIITTNFVTNFVTQSFLARANLYTNTSDGLSVSALAIEELQLTSNQVPIVNGIVRNTEQNFWQIERKHAERMVDASGHVHVSIKSFAGAGLADVGKLGQQFWADLGAVLTSSQVDNARKHLFERALLPANRPTILLDIWKDPDGTYHCTETTESARRGGPARENSVFYKGTNFNAAVPPRFWPYWTEKN